MSYLGWHGSQHSFEFASKQYAVELLQDNSRKVINASPEARAVIFAAQRQPVAVPPRITNKNTDADEFIACIGKLEGAKGPASRRSILAQALKKISCESKRHELILEASKIEVSATLEKVDALKTPAAKRRGLMAAIEQLRNDEIADDLQAVQLQSLEAALQDIDKS